MNTEVTMTDNSSKVKKEVEQALYKAARMIGGTLEGHAKEYAPVDTGLLRNSITFAIGGEPPAIASYRGNDKNKNGQIVEKAEGSYAGVAPKDKKGEVTVYIGTNVKYAPFQELGAPSRNLPARPFIRPAIENHTDEIEQILEQNMRHIR